MRDNISTIPITDGFEPKCGCPMCRLESMLEKRAVEFIMGDAMMQPDVRIQTNKLGFCSNHYSKMLVSGKRLTNALILESHLQEIINEMIPEKVSGKPDKKTLKKIESQTNTCFVCDKINWGMEHLSETVVGTFINEESFRKLLSEQEYICLPHYHRLLSTASQMRISGKNLAEFYKALNDVSGKYLSEVKADITHFCSMFDYRSAGKDWGNSKDSIERAIAFLTGKTEDTNILG